MGENGNDEPDRILMDTGPSDDAYRVVGDLRKKSCSRCNRVFYSSWDHDFCPECYVLDVEERRLGRRLTKEEEFQALREVGLLD